MGKETPVNYKVLTLSLSDVIPCADGSVAITFKTDDNNFTGVRLDVEQLARFEAALQEAKNYRIGDTKDLRIDDPFAN